MPRAVIVSQSEESPVRLPTDARFLRADRLLKTDEYSSVFAFRRVLRGSHFSIHYRRSDLGCPRLGVVVAKKLARHAALRNLIKRSVREHFRTHRSELPSLDLVVRLAARVDTLTRRELRDEIAVLMRKLPR